MSGLADAFNQQVTRTDLAHHSPQTGMDHVSHGQDAIFMEAGESNKRVHDYRHFPNGDIPDIGHNGIHVDPSINPPNIGVVIAAANEMPEAGRPNITEKPRDERTIGDVINDAAARDERRIARRNPSLNPGHVRGGGMMA